MNYELKLCRERFSAKLTIFLGFANLKLAYIQLGGKKEMTVVERINNIEKELADISEICDTFREKIDRIKKVLEIDETIEDVAERTVNIERILGIGQEDEKTEYIKIREAVIKVAKIIYEETDNTEAKQVMKQLGWKPQ